MPPDQVDDPDLEEEEGAAAEDADANNGAQGRFIITDIWENVLVIIAEEVYCS